MVFPVNLELLRDTAHMPALPVLQRSMLCGEMRLHDFCIPVNPYFPPSALLNRLRESLTDVLRYYPSDNETIANLIGEFVGIAPENIVAANGSTELITWINQHFISRSLATDIPTFGRWTDNARELGRPVFTFRRRLRDRFQLDVAEFVRFARERQASALAICNPNNPTGALLTREQMRQLLDKAQDFEFVIIDESFIDFAAEDEIPSVAADALQYDNVIVIKSLGKNLGLHGIRCGYAVAKASVAAKLRRLLPPWNVNSLAEELLRLMLQHREAYESARRRVVRDSSAFAQQLAAVDGLSVFPTHANFVFCQAARDIPGVKLRDVLLREHGCFVRECGSKVGSNSQFLRIAVRPDEQQRLLLKALPSAIDAVRERKRQPRVRVAAASR